MRQPSVRVSLNPRAPLLAHDLGAAVVLGSSFALLAPGLGRRAPVAALAEPLGLEPGPDEPRIVCLWGRGEVSLPGALARARRLPSWSPVGLWLDREVYEAGQPIHLMVTCPGLREAPVHISDGAGRSKVMRVPLHGPGLGHLELHRLPPGRWRLSLEVPGAGEGPGARCEARVLDGGSPEALTARWLWREVSVDPSRRGPDGQLGAMVRFAVLLGRRELDAAGPVRLSLLDLRQGGRHKLPGVLAPDPFGVVRGKAPLLPGGPWALCLRLGGGAGLETRLALPSGPEAARLRLMGPLCPGAVLTPAPEQDGGVLGLLMTPAEAPSPEAPVTLDPRLRGRRLTLDVHQPVRALCALVLEPLSQRARLHRFGAARPGDRLELPADDPLGLVAAAAFVGQGPREVPWEGWGGWLLEADPEGVSLGWGEGTRPGVAWRRAVPGRRPRLVVEAGHADDPATVLVVVRREEAPAPGAGGSSRGLLAALGSRLWADADALAEALECPDGLVTLYDAVGGAEAVACALEEARALAAGQEPPPDLRAEVMASEATHDAGEEVELAPAWQAPLPVEGAQPEVIQIELLSVAGRSEVSLDVPSGAGRLQIEAVSVAGGRWSTASARLGVGPFASASLSLPPFAEPGDEVRARLEVDTWEGVARLTVEVDGRPVEAELHPATPGVDQRAVPPGGALPPRAWLTFPVHPGLWRVKVEGPAGERPLVMVGVVSRAGRRRRLGHALRPVWPGEPPVDASEVGAQGGLDVLPSPVVVLERLLKAIAGVEWGTCESRAARMVAATVGLLRGVGDATGWRATLVDEVEALEGLFEAGRGFAASRPGGPIDPLLSQWTVRHLLRLEALAGGLEAEVACIERAGKLARRAAMAADVVLPPPPDELRDADDADLLLRFRPDRLAVAAATARARLKRRASVRDRELGAAAGEARGEVQRRCDLAYAARVLLACDDVLDRRLGLSALGEALSLPGRSFIGPDGLVGTLDTVAAIFALNALLEQSSEAGTVALEGDPGASAGATRVEARHGVAWVGWRAWSEDDLTDPAGAVPFEVSLRRAGSRVPEVRYELGERLELHLDLGDPARGGGWRLGDRLEVHLPAALAPEDLSEGQEQAAGGLGFGARRLWIDPAGRHHVEVKLRAVAPTARAQHLAAAVRNVYDGGRGRGMVGLDVAVSADDKGLGARLKGLLGG